MDYINKAGSIDSLLLVRNFGKKTLTELQDLLLKVEDSPNDTSQSTVKEDSPMEHFFVKYKKLMEIEVYSESIRSYYEANKSKLSVRAVHVLEANFPSISDALELYFSGLDMSKLWSCGQKTFVELNLFIRNLYNYTSSLFEKDNEELNLALIKCSYPFLAEDEVKFVADFKERTMHFPMFYILYHYLTNSNSRTERIYCTFFCDRS